MRGVKEQGVEMCDKVVPCELFEGLDLPVLPIEHVGVRHRQLVPGPASDHLKVEILFSHLDKDRLDLGLESFLGETLRGMHFLVGGCQEGV